MDKNLENELNSKYSIQIISKIGQGGYGAVYEILQTDGSYKPKSLALKLLENSRNED